MYNIINKKQNVYSKYATKAVIHFCHFIGSLFMPVTKNCGEHEVIKPPKAVFVCSSDAKVFPCKKLSNAWKNGNQLVLSLENKVDVRVVLSSIAVF